MAIKIKAKPKPKQKPKRVKIPKSVPGDKRRNNGGARAGAGAPRKYDDNDINRPFNTTVAIPILVKREAKRKHGTLGNAIRFAATYGPDDVV